MEEESLGVYNQRMDKKTSVLAVLAGVVLIVVLVVVATTMRRASPGIKNVPGGGVGEKAATSTRQAAPVNVVVPEVNSSSTTPANVAVPKISTEAARDAAVSSNFRKFEMQVRDDVFVPNTVIVNQGDAVEIDITAIDKDYYFTQPEKRYDFLLPKGKSMPLAFTAAGEGNFLFYCSSCGGPEKGPTGHLIVVPKK